MTMAYSAMAQIETMELANGVIIREHGRVKRGPNEVGVHV